MFEKLDMETHQLEGTVYLVEDILRSCLLDITRANYYPTSQFKYLRGT